MPCGEFETPGTPMKAKLENLKKMKPQSKNNFEIQLMSSLNDLKKNMMFSTS